MDQRVKIKQLIFYFTRRKIKNNQRVQTKSEIIRIKLATNRHQSEITLPIK